MTSDDMLQRGAQLDQAARRLIIEAASDPATRRDQPIGSMLKQTAVTVEIINHTLDSGGIRQRELLGHAAQRVSAEAEPQA